MHHKQDNSIKTSSFLYDIIYFVNLWAFFVVCTIFCCFELVLAIYLHLQLCYHCIFTCIILVIALYLHCVYVHIYITFVSCLCLCLLYVFSCILLIFSLCFHLHSGCILILFEWCLNFICVCITFVFALYLCLHCVYTCSNAGYCSPQGGGEVTQLCWSRWAALAYKVVVRIFVKISIKIDYHHVNVSLTIIDNNFPGLGLIYIHIELWEAKKYVWKDLSE